jgi:integrase
MSTRTNQEPAMAGLDWPEPPDSYWHRQHADHTPTAGQSAQGAGSVDAATTDATSALARAPESCGKRRKTKGSSLPSTASQEAKTMADTTTKTKKGPRRNVGEIILRGSIWWVRYYDLRGLRRFESTRSTDREDAEKRLRQRLTAKDAGLQPEAAVGKLTLKDALTDVVNDYTTNGKKSLKDVQGKIRLHLHPFFGEHRKMTTITTAALREFVVARQEAEASNAEINRELAVLRRAFNLAIQAGRLLAKPHFPMLKERNTRTGFLERDQIDRICAALAATETDDDGRKTAKELANVVRFAFTTGWRTASEVLPLQWRSVDWSGRCVRLDPHTTKNGEARSFPFTGGIEKVLKEQLAIHEALKKTGRVVPFVFHRDGERIKYFRAAWGNACEQAGCPNALVHDMRRSAVRTFERAGVPRSAAMSMVGHKTASIYQRYAIVDEAMQREAAIRLDSWAKSEQLRSSGVVLSLSGKDRRRQ